MRRVHAQEINQLTTGSGSLQQQLADKEAAMVAALAAAAEAQEAALKRQRAEMDADAHLGKQAATSELAAKVSVSAFVVGSEFQNPEPSGCGRVVHSDSTKSHQPLTTPKTKTACADR